MLTICLRFSPSIFLFSPPPLLRTVSTGLIVLLLCINIWYFHHIYPPSCFLYAHQSKFLF
jgi:hypothetical protein